MFRPTVLGALLVYIVVGLGSHALADTTSDDAYIPTVFVTGGNRGIGFEFVRQYADAGWNVIATARSPDKADDLQALASDNPRITIEQLDVTDIARIDELAAKYVDQPIDVLLNNAAISGSPSREQSFRRLDYDLFDPFMQTNAMGPLKISEAFYQHVEASQQKKIVVISSSGGLFSRANSMAKGTYLYRASKAALNMLMLQVAGDVKRYGITVILLNPGLVDTQKVLTEMNETMKLGLTLTLIEDSIAGMRKVIDEKGLDESGRMWQWTGEPLDW
jgi:NAD(P)-dependent dehydrogenase (short-subunit alcohol dehydrogenase family)